jgi:hypothetical protein
MAPDGSRQDAADAQREAAWHRKQLDGRAHGGADRPVHGAHAHQAGKAIGRWIRRPGAALVIRTMQGDTPTPTLMAWARCAAPGPRPQLAAVPFVGAASVRPTGMADVDR